MKTIRLLFICLVFALLHANMSFALENSNNSGALNESTIKNFTYLKYFPNLTHYFSTPGKYPPEANRRIWW